MSGKTGRALDEERRARRAYEYLCHIEEMRQWMKEVLDDDLPAASELENIMRTGVILGRLVLKFQGDQGKLKEKKIFDMNEEVYKTKGLKFKHTQNIFAFIEAMDVVGMPKIFYPEVTDLSDKKNLPKVIYCIHALAHYLYRRGIINVRIKDLVDEVEFTEEEINAVDAELNRLGVKMPAFGKVGGVVAKELSEDQAAMHAAVLAINQAVEQRVAANTKQALLRGSAGIERVNAECDGDAYQYVLWRAIKTKQGVDPSAPEPNAPELEAASEAVAEEEQNEEAVDGVPAGGKADAETEESPRNLSQSKAHSISMENASKAGSIFIKDKKGLKAKLERKESQKEILQNDIYEKMLTQAEIQSGVNQANELIGTNAVNEAAGGDDAEATFKALNLLSTGAKKAYQDLYHDALHTALAAKEGLTLVAEGTPAGRSGVVEQRWLELSSGKDNFVSHSDIRSAVETITEREDRWAHMQENVADIIKAQAAVRRRLAMNKFRRLQDERDTRLAYLAIMAPKALKIQSAYRAMLARKVVARMRQAKKERDAYLADNETAVIKIQAWWRMARTRKAYRARLAWLARIDPTRIQAWWRGLVQHRAYKSLVSDDPKAFAIRRHLYLLDNAEIDTDDELLLQRLRMKCTGDIQANQERSKKLDELYVKIGLLIENRISLDSVKQTQKLIKKSKAETRDAVGRSEKAMSAEAVKRHGGYQHLFYLLQTEARYLSKLMYLMPTTQTKKFLENIIFPLFSNAQTDREVYLLLKIFLETIKAETEQVESPSDFVEGDPTVIKMAVMFNRKGPAEGKFLRTLLGPLVEKVMDPEVNLLVEPRKVLQYAIQREEESTGVATTRNVNATNAEAYKDKVVQKVVNLRLTKLKKTVHEFIDAMVANVDEFPYGIRYIAMQMRLVLTEKFPDKDAYITKNVLGYVVYYRYISSAIVSPEYYDIINVKPEDIKRQSKSNLSLVADLITHCVYETTYEEDEKDAGYMTSLNPFVLEMHAKLKKFFLAVSTVENPEVHFNIDQYYEQTLSKDPEVKLKQEYISKTHTLLVKFLDDLDPSEDETNRLRIILKDLGEVVPHDETGQVIDLHLQDRFSVEDEHDADIRAFIMKSKQSMVSLMRCMPAPNKLKEYSTMEISKEAEQKNMSFRATQKRLLNENRRKSALLPDANDTSSTDGAKSEETLKQFQETLQGAALVLEQAGKLTADEYPELLLMIAMDIRTQGVRRQRRNKEINLMHRTGTSLAQKAAILDERQESYETVVDACMQRMSTGLAVKKSFFSRFKNHHVVKDKAAANYKFGSFKYSAKELIDRGIICKADISGLAARAVTVILSSNETGVFNVKAKAGTYEEDEEVLLDSLLNFRYEGTRLYPMFDGAVTMNVNLFIHMLNKKFLVAESEAQAKTSRDTLRRSKSGTSEDKKVKVVVTEPNASEEKGDM